MGSNTSTTDLAAYFRGLSLLQLAATIRFRQVPFPYYPAIAGTPLVGSEFVAGGECHIISSTGAPSSAPE